MSKSKKGHDAESNEAPSPMARRTGHREAAPKEKTTSKSGLKARSIAILICRVQTQEARRWNSGQEEAALVDQQRLQASTEDLPSDIRFQEEPGSGRLRTVPYGPREDFGGRAKLCSTDRKSVV